MMRYAYYSSPPPKKIITNDFKWQETLSDYIEPVPHLVEYVSNLSEHPATFEQFPIPKVPGTTKSSFAGDDDALPFY